MREAFFERSSLFTQVVCTFHFSTSFCLTGGKGIMDYIHEGHGKHIKKNLSIRYKTAVSCFEI